MRIARIVLVVSLLTSAACMTGPRRVNNMSPGDFLVANSPGQLWATLKDGEQMEIDGPKVIQDTIFGWSEGEEVSIPTSDLKEIKVRKMSAFRTSIIPLVLLGGVVGAFTIKHGGTAPPIDSTQTNFCKYNANDPSCLP